jgi:hypothetical protein
MERKFLAISRLEGYAPDKACYPLHAKGKARREWIEQHELYLADNGRVFALIDSNLGQVLMDCITGSIYKHGRCLTGNLTVSGLASGSPAAKALLEKRVDYRSDD